MLAFMINWVVIGIAGAWLGISAYESDLITRCGNYTRLPLSDTVIECKVTED